MSSTAQRNSTGRESYAIAPSRAAGDSRELRPKPLLTLTSLRLVAALVIVVFHYFLGPHPNDAAVGVPSIHEAIQTYLPLLSHGDVMVDFFFVLSGFVLALVYSASIESGRFRFRSFIVKRFARIYPLHFFMLCLYVAFWILGRLAGVGPAGKDQFSLYAVLTNVLMVHAWGLNELRTLNGVSWSISAEWFAYLLFPIIVHLVYRFRPAKSLLLALSWFGLLFYFGGNQSVDLVHRTAEFGILRIAAEFPLGLALYRVYDRILQRNVTRNPRVAPSSMCFFAIVIAALLSMQFHAPSWLRVLLLAATVLQAAIAESRGGLKWLCHPLLVYGGEISFSIYMTHEAVALIANKIFVLAHVTLSAWSTDSLMLACIPVTLFVSHLAYQYIERPSRDWLTLQLASPRPVPLLRRPMFGRRTEANPSGIVVNR